MSSVSAGDKLRTLVVDDNSDVRFMTTVRGAGYINVVGGG